MRLKTLAVTAGAFTLVAAAMAPIAMRATTTQAASSKISAGAPNFTGVWLIDRKNSDKPPQGGMGGGGEHMHGGGGGGGGHHGGGEWGGPPPGGGGPGGPGGPEGARGGGMRRMLPPTMRITTSDQGISVADSSGTIPIPPAS